MNASTNVVTWIPEAWYPALLTIKGVLALAGVIMLLYHMNYEWPRMRSLGQRSRYLALLAYTVLSAGATAEQLEEGALLSYRHLGALSVAIILVVSMWISIRESRQNRSVRSS